MRRLLAIVIGLAVLALPAAFALAHHGFTGRYDLSQPVWIRGEVTQAYFGQPHPTLTIRTAPDLALPATPPDPAGARGIIAIDRLMVRAETRGGSVTIEFPPIPAFFNLDRSLGVGDTVAVIAFRNCEAPHQLRAQWLLADKAGASPIVRGNRQSYQVERC